MFSKLPSVATMVCILMLPAAQAVGEEEGNWKKGRIYYRAVCTACHEAETGNSISPAAYTIQEWKDYVDSEEGGAHFNEYVSQTHREALAPENKVAAAFAKLSNEEVWADVRAFVIYGAKDSATPATCS